MRTGSIYDVVDVLKSLNHLSQSKNLSFREKRMLDRSRFLVVSEMAEVMKESDEAVEERVEKALERCLVNRIRLLEKAKMAKKKTAKAKTAASKKASSRAAASRTAAAS
jgi:CarD family transcriptional regulator